MAENLDLPELHPIVDEAGKPRLDLDHVDKNRIASMVLISARQILCSHDVTPHHFAKDIASICYEAIEK